MKINKYKTLYILLSNNSYINNFIKKSSFKSINSTTYYNFGSGHHHITGKVDLDKTYVTNNVPQNMISLCGLQSNNKSDNLISYTVSSTIKRNGQISPFDIGNRFNSSLSSVNEEENPYAHSEPYGYLLSDDPNEKAPIFNHTYTIIFAVVLLIAGLPKLLRSEKYVNPKHTLYWRCENLYHAQYAASMIEQEILKIREEDYPWREKYNELTQQEKLKDNLESEEIDE